LKIVNLKKMSLPKIAVLATGLTAAILAATLSPQAAQATPRAADCADCHIGSASTATTATPSTATPAAGATYTVAITLAANSLGGLTGYGIVPVAPATGSTFGGETGSELSFTATMTAPASAGTYSYTVFTNMGSKADGQVGSKVYTITVGTAATTPPATTTTPPVDTTTTTPPVDTTTTTPPVDTTTTTPPVDTTTTPAATTPAATTTTTAPAVVAGDSASTDGSAVIPVGAPNTGAGGAAGNNDGLMGLGGLALLLAGAGATQVVRRRQQV